MDSACFTCLCFLLLAGPALHPGVAVSRDDPAEGMNGSSFGKTTVTVYHCKECESKSCKLSNYTGFVKIGETQNETFENEIFQLVTSETRITMCFQQEITYLKGVYAIVWEKAWGIGDSCGILKVEDSLENRRHSIREDEKTCCEALTQPTVFGDVLKCYTKMTDEKNRNSVDITDDGNLGNPQYSVSENRRIGITATFLILGVCAAAALVLLYFVRRTQNRQGARRAEQASKTQNLTAI